MSSSCCLHSSPYDFDTPPPFCSFSVFCVSPPGIHVSLVICVRGYTYHGDTHITVTAALLGSSDLGTASTSLTCNTMSLMTGCIGGRCSRPLPSFSDWQVEKTEVRSVLKSAIFSGVLAVVCEISVAMETLPGMLRNLELVFSTDQRRLGLLLKSMLAVSKNSSQLSLIARFTCERESEI